MWLGARGKNAVTAAATGVVVMSAVVACTPDPGSRPTNTATHTGFQTPTAVPGDTSVLGAKWDWSRVDAFEPYLGSLSGSSTFYEAVWCDIEREQGSLDWETVDDVVERSRALDIDMMLKIRVGTCWATGGDAEHERGAKQKTESGMPKDLEVYQEFVRTIVARYADQGVHTFAVENEINAQSFWSGTHDEYAELVSAASEAIREEEPEARVVDPGLSSTTYGYGIADRLLAQGDVEEALEAWNLYYERRIGTRGDQLPEVTDRAELEAVLDSEQGVRNLGYLALVTQLAEERVVDVRQIHFYEKWTAVPLLFEYLRTTTPGHIPIEAWEVGNFDIGGGAHTERDDEVLKTVGLVLAGGASKVIWLPLAHDPSGRNSDEPRLGLLDPGGHVRDAGEQYLAIADAARTGPPVPMSSGDLTGVGFSGDSGTTAFVWAADSEEVQVQLLPDDEVVGASASSGTVVVADEPLQLRLGSTLDEFLVNQ